VIHRRKRCPRRASVASETAARPSVATPGRWHDGRNPEGMLNAPSVVALLEHLLVVAADGVEGYRRAADAVDAPAGHRFLAELAADRERVVCALTLLLVEHGRKPSHHGSLRGALHRRWIDAISAVRPGALGPILHACERGEAETIRTFESALAEDVPDDVRAVVEAQLERVRDSVAKLATWTAAGLRAAS
jgi:uncharacterized protein (TIGR02284 family)